MERDREEGLRAAEHRLQAAQLAADVDTLDALLDGGAVFAGPDGSLSSKDDDLDASRSGRQVLRRLDELDLRVRVVGPTGVTWLLAELEGSVDGQAFTARVRYTRTWVDDDRAGWRVVAAQATIAA